MNDIAHNMICGVKRGFAGAKIAFLAGAIAFGALLAQVALAPFGLDGSGQAYAQFLNTSAEEEQAPVNSIIVRGNRRLDAATVRSYLTIKAGQPFTSFDTDESLRALFATGLFSDVDITREGGRLIVTVTENPTINLIRFEGNDKVKDEILQSVIQLESLGVFDEDKLKSDEERVKEAMRRSGRSAATVSSKVEKLEDNRVDIVFVISEGGRTRITSIEFVGNKAFSDRVLDDVILHRENNLLSWIKRDDVFAADRLQADEERLRQYYYNRGYADFSVISTDAKLDEENNTYSITITVSEGQRYTLGSVEIISSLDIATSEVLEAETDLKVGDVYNARTVERNLEHLTEFIARTGYAFAEVTPRGERHPDKGTIDLTLFVDEGPRIYIERIEINGNERSRDYVIRREFDISEGDPYNTVLVNRARNRLNQLGYFNSVQITTREGSAPDRIIIVVDAVDRATGELSIGGGYSSNGGIIGEASINEKNFLGRGHEVKLTGGFGSDTQTYEMAFTEPYFLGERIAAGFDLRTQTTEPSNGVRFGTRSTLFRLRSTIDLSEYLDLATDYTYQYDKFNSPTIATTLSPATRDSVNRSPFVVSSVGYDLLYNGLDDLNNPRNGIKGEFSQDIAGVGGDAAYVRSTGRVTAYYLISEERDLVLTGSIASGLIEPLNDDLRVVDHFFQGGETTRGFSANGFGPRASTGEPVGGAKYVNASVEAQFPFPLVSRNLGLRGAVFLDAGTLFDNKFNDQRGRSVLDFNAIVTAALAGNSAEIDDAARLRASTGVSIIWDSPFGPLRGDFSRVLSEEKSDETQTFRFGISSRF